MITSYRSRRYCIVKVILFFLLFFVFFSGWGQKKKVKSVAASWGDQLNGTYRNPILAADYSDPDVIRVGNKFYMVCSDFHFMGMPVLESEDLVNWKIIGKVYTKLNINKEYDEMKRYGGGSWAPSIRYHNHRFYVYFCTPDEGVFMSTATRPGGPWSALKCVKAVRGWEDPCPFWDDNGNAYLGHSKLGAGPIIIHKMNSEGTQLLDSGITVYSGPVSEGTKIYKRNGYYYILIPEGGVSEGYETALRAKTIYGPYERRKVLEQGKTAVNGPHQGGLVELANGESWFIHFQSIPILGRICHLEPVVWKNNWPLMGKDTDGNDVGEPVSVWKKPNVGKQFPMAAPQTSDEFNGPALGLQWQWNHNPDSQYWSLSRNHGFLTLISQKASSLHFARNTITQKLTGFKGTVTALLKVDEMKSGQQAGLCLFGSKDQQIGVIGTNNVKMLYVNNDREISYGDTVENWIYLRAVIHLDVVNGIYFMYSKDGRTYKKIGKNCVLSNDNYWKGVRPGLFSYNVTSAPGGVAKFDWFHYKYEGPVNGF